MRITMHKDGTVSVRVDKDELTTLTASAVFGWAHWQERVSDDGLAVSNVHSEILTDHAVMRDALVQVSDKLGLR